MKKHLWSEKKIYMKILTSECINTVYVASWLMFMDAVKEDAKMVGVPEQEAKDRVRWTQMIRCVDP